MSNTKRVGIPINSIEKYIGLMQNYDASNTNDNIGFRLRLKYIKGYIF